ncbi:small acid-soluble spore protein Tlp [Rossellomorea vietnamensis]|uniref:Small, acid-soluble spore protein Tlp n=1 Tax=Rossellomorea vietnamensis TaxID=218284 RepID=A0A5D4NXX5_9BACI|nr:small acid-soluble spore protein Tlp [Rossellomorea vietnamensis]TYS17552.1 small acid-soluble spore protein Tlp [Rossellomorea vietnamensis]
MAEQQNRPNPDDRSDNVEKLQSKVFHTIQNMERAEESLAYTDSEEQIQSIQAKNDRRRESIDAFRSEIKEEAAFQKNGQNNQYQ